LNEKEIVHKINRKLFSHGKFLVKKFHAGRQITSYCLAKGSQLTARYEVVDKPVDVNLMFKDFE